MGYFVLCEVDDPDAKDLINTAIANIELYLDDPSYHYLLSDFAIPMLKEALEKLPELEQ